MGGTTKGGLKTKRTVYKLYGKNYYKNIGAKGGAIKNPKKGFGSMPKEKIIEAGTKGGAISRRYKSKKSCVCSKNSVCLLHATDDQIMDYCVLISSNKS